MKGHNLDSDLRRERRDLQDIQESGSPTGSSTSHDNNIRTGCLPPWLQRQRDVVGLADRDVALRSGPKRLFGVLVEAAGEKGCCYWPNGGLASRLRVKPRTIRAWLAVLERNGWIQCRHLEQRAELPGQNGDAVENEDGMRLIVVRGLWTGGSIPGVPYDRRPPEARRRGHRSALRSSGEDHGGARKIYAVPGGEDQPDLRKEKMQRGKVVVTERGESPPPAPSPHALGNSGKDSQGPMLSPAVQVREDVPLPKSHGETPTSEGEGSGSPAWRDAVAALRTAGISIHTAEDHLGCYLRKATASQILDLVTERGVDRHARKVAP